MMIQDIVHFSKNSVIYNRQLSIGSTIIDNNRGNKVERINGAHSVKINGSVSYYIKKNVGTDFFNGINYFTFDNLELDTVNTINASQSLSSATKFGPMIKYVYMKKLFDYMKIHNALCKELRMIGKTIIQQTKTFIHQTRETEHTAIEQLRAQINGSSSFLEVAGFTADTLHSKRQITYELKGEKKYLSMQNSQTEGIMYPLLFLHNECGWRPEYKKELSQYKYMCSRILMPEKDWIVPNKNGDRWLKTNRFQVMSRLSQHMMVEVMCQAQDYKLNWHKRNNEAIRSGGGLQQNIETPRTDIGVTEHDAVTESNDDGGQHGDNINEDPERIVNSDSSPSFLADSFTGAPRHLKALSLNALAVVTELGQPTVFITLTVNPKWREIEEQLLPGQTAFDRPDVVVPVFKQRLSAIIHNLKNGKYFGGRQTVYKIYVIEYQHRGLPHAHIVVKLKDVDDNDNDAKLVFIDEFIRARFPPAGEDLEYATLIEEHMIHKCSDADNGCLNEKGHCKRGYQLNEVRAKSIFDEKGYPIYARPSSNDLRVVPHNREILLDWQGHANVEFCADSYAVLYLYKYLFKGNRKVTMQLDNVDDVHNKDEILLFQRGRMICAMQAMFVFLGYQQYPASDPSVILIKVKDPTQLLNITSSKQLCDMFIYFSRPRTQEFSQLTYKQFFQKWNYCRNPIQFRDGRRTIQLPLQHSSIRTVCLFERSSKSNYNTIIRLAMVPSTIGETFWLRTMLNRYPVYSYVELRTINGVEYRTFQEAACALDFHEKKELATTTFKECLAVSNAHEMRMLFVNMTTTGLPTIHIFNEPKFQEFMARDLRRKVSHPNLMYNQLLIELASLFKLQENTTMQDYGLPEPQSQQTELDFERLKYDRGEQYSYSKQLLRLCPFTTEMKHLMDDIEEALDTNDTLICLLQGRAGSGKSTFAKYVAAFVRSKGLICKGCASTGLAAAVYDDFTTAHSLFAIPVIEDSEDFEQENELICKLNIAKYKERRELLSHTRCIIWDEISSQHVRDINSVLGPMNFFKGKVVLFIGDGLQITPVVPNGAKSQICSSSIYCSPLLDHLKIEKYTFSKNLRLTNADVDINQKIYARLLDSISTNIVHPTMSTNTVVDSTVPSSLVHVIDDSEYNTTGLKKIKIQYKLNLIKSTDDVIEFCHPGGLNYETAHHGCILAATNEQVDKWNSVVQEKNPEDPYTLLADDKFEDVDDDKAILPKMLNDHVLQRYNSSGNCPPHVLTLKVNDLCILMRAVDKKQKFTTNTRVRVVAISGNIVRVCSIDEENPRYVNLNRFKFKVKLPYGNSFTMTRSQFPLRLAYALTINKSQGQTLRRAVVDLTTPPFSHGHLNVALSRITNAINIAIYIGTDPKVVSVDENGFITTDNYVYKEILQALNIRV